MNANELADKRHDCQTFTELLVWGMDAEEMLRQQQAEIEVLKAHPVKELTDEEIIEIWHLEKSSGELYYDLLTFANNLLKKVQEK